MSAEEHFAFVTQLSGDRVLDPELLAEPQGKGLEVRPETSRRVRGVGFEQPDELHERLLVEANQIDLVYSDAALAQAVRDRMRRKACVVLLAREPLFLSGGNDVAVDKEACGRVVVVSRNSEDAPCHGFRVIPPCGFRTFTEKSLPRPATSSLRGDKNRPDTMNTRACIRDCSSRP